jgi:hypothetical protein
MQLPSDGGKAGDIHVDGKRADRNEQAQHNGAAVYGNWHEAGLRQPARWGQCVAPATRGLARREGIVHR